MQNPGHGDDASLIADLNDLLQLDHDAVEAYTIAINLARDESLREPLVEFRADHKRHIEELAGLVRGRGGLPLEMPHPTGPLKMALQALGGAASDDVLLLAFKAVEGQTRDKYRRFARHRYPEDVAEVVRRAAEDEEKHYEWGEGRLRARGMGEGTLPHGLARLVEGIHKVIADPVESVYREVVERVGSAMGSSDARGGRSAPTPVDVAAGMAARAMDEGAAMAARAVDQADGAAERGRDRDRDEDLVSRAVDQADGMTSRPAEPDEVARAAARSASDAAREPAPIDSPLVGPGGRPAREELRERLGEGPAGGAAGT